MAATVGHYAIVITLELTWSSFIFKDVYHDIPHDEMGGRRRMNGWPDGLTSSSDSFPPATWFIIRCRFFFEHDPFLVPFVVFNR